MGWIFFDGLVQRLVGSLRRSCRYRWAMAKVVAGSQAWEDRDEDDGHPIFVSGSIGGMPSRGKSGEDGILSFSPFSPP